MANLLYIISLVLVLAWLVGFLAFPAVGGLIHILLVLSIISFLLRVIRGV